MPVFFVVIQERAPEKSLNDALSDGDDGQSVVMILYMVLNGSHCKSSVQALKECAILSCNLGVFYMHDIMCWHVAYIDEAEWTGVSKAPNTSSSNVCEGLCLLT